MISVGHIQAGSPDALNVMPSELVIGGTMRSFTPEVQALLDRRITELAELCAAAQGTTAEVALSWNAIPTVNHARETEVAVAAARAVPGVTGVNPEAPPVTGGEDFSFMLRQKPGAFLFLAQRDGACAAHAALRLQRRDDPLRRRLLPGGGEAGAGVAHARVTGGLRRRKAPWARPGDAVATTPRSTPPCPCHAPPRP